MAKKFQKLTRKNMRALEPGKSLAEYGIEYQRLLNGDGRFSINIMVDGCRVHRVVGKESDGITRKQAEELIETYRTSARAGRLNLPKGRKLVVVFDQAAKQYLDILGESGGKDLYSKRHRLRDHLIPHFGKKPLDKIASLDIERYKSQRKKGEAKEGTINRELAVLSHLISMAVEWGWISHAPTKIKRFKEAGLKCAYLTSEQINSLISEAKKDQNPYIYLFVEIGVATGMRKMEICSIRISDIDLHKRVIHIPKAKAGGREQPITDHLAEILAQHLEHCAPDQEWLFPANSKSGHLVSIEKPFKRIAAEAGLDTKEVSIHTLRHTTITHLVQDGVDLPTVMRISGHKSLSMVQRYSHQNGSHIREAMSRLEKRVAGGAC